MDTILSLELSVEGCLNLENATMLRSPMLPPPPPPLPASASASVARAQSNASMIISTENQANRTKNSEQIAGCSHWDDSNDSALDLNEDDGVDLVPAASSVFGDFDFATLGFNAPSQD